MLALLHAGVRGDTTAADGDIRPLLHAAAVGGHTVLALALLRHGCSACATNEDVRSAARLALDNGFSQTALAMLRAAGEADAGRLLGPSA